MKNCVSTLQAALLLCLLTLSLTACKTTPKIDWNSRIGTYTYDQAIAELGPPDKAAQLSDGRTVAEWVVGRTSSSGFSIGTGFYGGHGGMGVGQTVGSAPGLKLLRLTFGPDNLLQAWANVRT
jgi:hypothetical protein